MKFLSLVMLSDMLVIVGHKEIRAKKPLWDS